MTREVKAGAPTTRPAAPSYVTSPVKLSERSGRPHRSHPRLRYTGVSLRRRHLENEVQLTFRRCPRVSIGGGSNNVQGAPDPGVGGRSVEQRWFGRTARTDVLDWASFSGVYKVRAWTHEQSANERCALEATQKLSSVG